MKLPVYLINLDRSPQRLASAQEVLAGLGLDHRRVAAVDGQAVTPQEQVAWRTDTARGRLGRPLLPGEIGCFLSHIDAARQIVAAGDPLALVIEDDALARAGAGSDLAALTDILSHGGIPDWDLVNLARAPRRFFRPLASLPSGAVLGRAHYFPVTTTAILWSADGARRFLETAQELSAPVDVFLQSWLCQSGRGLACSPAPFSDSGAQSQITQGRRNGGTLARLRRQAANNLAALRSLARDR